ncbi:MAG: magnesium transporter CorA family protein [Chloroflexi bacterium]|nr:magnesium transporter CorA family protein [Chloroflexota bacterium]MCI0577288.1 magnesium transporter CorA family protein [Chloroflexota bacterium]MCI0647732.1 magnesium transporter CorA family protein [Chloroflexota bacterium]MCI0731596.1 magnesium transporter CorA family protein [Chloroflexota bacterium]
MIKIYRSTESGLEVVERPTKGCWIDMIDPGLEEARKLTQDAEIDLEFVTAVLELDEIPRVEKVDHALFILVRIPHFQGARARIPYVTLPMGIVLTDDMIITICKHEHELLRDLNHERQSALSTSQPHLFVLHLLWSITNRYLTQLGEINEIVDRLEDRLQRSLQNREVLELLRYQKSLVYFTTALRTNKLMLERLQRAELLELKPGDEDQLDDVITENYEAMEMTEIASDILSQTMDAFASIISNNLNVVMKFLASITVVLIVPQIIGTFYGMNVRLPMEDTPSTFYIMVGLSVIISGIVSFIFWKKDWL